MNRGQFKVNYRFVFEFLYFILEEPDITCPFTMSNVSAKDKNRFVIRGKILPMCRNALKILGEFG